MIERQHVDVSLTSISSRMDTVSDTIKSIINQSYENFSVNLYLSKESYLLDKGVPFIPDSILEIQKNSKINFKIIYCENIGPYRKLIPFLQENWGKSKLVVTADDDTIYPRNWLKDIVHYYNKYSCSIAYRGHEISFKDGVILPYKNWMHNDISKNPSQIIMPTGKDGILYNTSFFPVEILNMRDAKDLAPTADDLWFRWHLANLGIRVFIINTDYRTTFDESYYSESLYLNYNEGGNNDSSIIDINNYFISRFNFYIKKFL